MPRDLADVVALLRHRQASDDSLIRGMIEVRDAYYGDIPVALPEMESQEERVAVANLVANGIDAYGQRIGSVLPDIISPIIKRKGKVTEQSREYAETRRLAAWSWWQQNRMLRKKQRKGRWIVGYGIAPTVVKPDFRKRIPKFQIRDPLTTYPAPTDDPDELVPPDTIFTYTRSWGWLLENYPDAAAKFGSSDDIVHDSLFEIVEYIDAGQYLLGVVGRKVSPHAQAFRRANYGTGGRKIRTIGSITGEEVEEVLEKVDNRTGVPWAITPSRVTLDRRSSQFAQSIGLFQQQARLMALELIAIERAVFPDIVLMGRDGRSPVLVGNVWKDGRTGEINIVEDGQVDIVKLDPGFLTNNILDRLERSQRINTDQPSEFTGESASNIRTGRRGDAVMSAVVNFPIQEAQEALAESDVEELRVASHVMRSYFGDEPKSFYVTMKKNNQIVDYVPNLHFETEHYDVRYPMPGTDANSLIVMIGQQLGLELISQQTARQLLPNIEEPDQEDNRVNQEAIDRAMRERIIADPAVTLVDLVNMRRLLEDKNLHEAVQEAQEEAQKRQASITPEGEPDTVPPGSPEAQPGITPPEAGGAAATEAVPEQGPSLQNLGMMLGSLRSANRGVG